MNGIFVVDKPAGFTSFDVVAKMRGICKTRKIGHGGTLDPMATGVLPVFVGNAAKAVDLQPQQDKTYEASILFGTATDTGDITGQVLQQQSAIFLPEQVEEILPRFVGEQQQLPPMYSAIKINGKPLYKYAREGTQIERKPRQITIYSVNYLGLTEKGWHNIAVHCSKGTYIRTLAEDIGAALESCATLAALRRTAAGIFTLNDAHPLEEIQQAQQQGRLAELLLPVERVFSTLPAVHLGSSTAVGRLQNGAAVQDDETTPGRYRIYDKEDFLGLGKIENGELRAVKLFPQN